MTALSGAAWADVLPPDESACSSKSPGAPCAFAGDGCGDGAPCSCTSTTCHHDYSYFFCVDAGDGGGNDAGDGGLAGDAGCRLIDASVTYACISCAPGEPSVDGGRDAPDGGPAFDAGPALDGSIADGGAGDGAAGDAAAGDAAAEADAGTHAAGGAGCSCDLESTQALRSFAPWVFASLFPLLLQRRRRRPRA